MGLNTLSKAILKTIVYYDCLNYPLTLKDLKLFLFLNSNFILNDKELMSALNELENMSLIFCKDGFYFLEKRTGEDLVELRKKTNNIAKDKMKKTIKIVKKLTIIPFVHLIFVSGSLALGNIKEDGDLDLLVVGKFGRIWTVRFLIVVLTSLLGVRRKKNSKDVSDKICLNHFITDKSLYIPFKSIYTSQLYINLKPLYVRDVNLLEKFFRENSWVGEYVWGWGEKIKIKNLNFNLGLGEKADKGIVYIIRSAAEKILGGLIGDWIEALLRFLQKRRIERDPLTYKPGGRIVANDYYLEFHPNSQEKFILEKYNKIMKELGFEELADEKDSGLKK